MQRSPSDMHDPPHHPPCKAAAAPNHRNVILVGSLHAMGKRKRSDDPSTLLTMQPIEAAPGEDGQAGVGPFAVYFPSGFRPAKDAECSWRVYRHAGDPGRFVVVASTETVDFVGDSAGEDCSGPLTCRSETGASSKPAPAQSSRKCKHTYAHERSS